MSWERTHFFPVENVNKSVEKVVSVMRKYTKNVPIITSPHPAATVHYRVKTILNGKAPVRLKTTHSKIMGK